MKDSVRQTRLCAGSPCGQDEVKAANPWYRSRLAAVIVGGLSVLGASLAVAAPGKIVHNAAEALIAASENATNPYTDANGATWTVIARPSPNSGDAESELMTGSASYGDSARGIGSFWDFFFVMGERNSGAEGTHSDSAQVEFHPSSTKRAVLRFTAPRSGRYSLSARFRTTNSGSGYVDATVLFNGIVLCSENISHDPLSHGSLTQFEKLYLKAGDTLEFAVGPGYDSQDTNCDSTTLSLSIVEENMLAVDPSDRFDTTAALSAMIAQEPTNPYTDDKGAVWGLYDSTWTAWSWMFDKDDWCQDTYAEASTLSTVLPAHWYGLTTVRNHEEYCMAAINSTGVPQPANECPKLRALGPNEMAFHPGDNYCPRLRFTTPKAGTYMVTAIARNLDYGEVDVGLTAAGIPLTKVYSACQWSEGGAPDKGQILQAQTTWLAAGEAIELMVYNHNGKNTCDSTGLYFDVVRLPDEAWEGVDFGGALAASFKQDAPSNPFTDENGAWTCGKVASGFFSQLEPNAIYDERMSGMYKGWKFSDQYDADHECSVCANVADVMVGRSYGDDVTFMDTYPHELFFHPYADSQGAVLRFSPKEEKVYDLHCYARDLKVRADNWGGEVQLAITVNGAAVRAYAATVFTMPWGGGYQPFGFFEPSCFCQEVARQVKGIYLRPNDTVEIRIHSKTADNTYCATGVRAWLMPSVSACESFLNVDIEGAGAGSLFDGTAAAGFAGARWTQARPGETTPLKLNGRHMTKVGFNLVRGGSQAAVTDRQDGANALMDCGVVSANAEDPYQFTLNKLVPGANYRLVFYGDANAQFTVGEKSARVSEMCFTPGGKEYCVLDVVADANGLISGTFASAEGAASARFCGLQIGGATDSFALRTGLVLIVE